jgi:hypothetical protein
MKAFENAEGHAIITHKRLLNLDEKTLHKGSDEILMDTFRYIVPLGDYHKKKETDKLIRERVTNKPLRRRMLRLVELLPEKKSLYLAQKALGARDTKEIMAGFAEIGLSPVTISKRHDIKHLKCLHGYFDEG